MSVRVISIVWDGSKSKGGDLLVLLALADFAHDNGIAFPSVATLAKKARLTQRQTQAVLRKLETKGELEIKLNAGPHGTNLYRVTAVKGGDERASPLSEAEMAHQAGGITWPGVSSASSNGEARIPEGVNSASYEPSGTVTGEQEHPSPVVLVTKAQRDAVWSALAHETQTYPETISERSLFGKCVKELSLAGATPEEISVRCERYRKKYDGAVLTPKALVSHWGDLATVPRRKGGGMTADEIRAMKYQEQ